MFKNRLVLIDGNHLIHRAFWKFKNLKTFEGIPTSVLYGGPYILESLIRKLSPEKLVVVFDDERSQFRKNLLPGYKERESRLGDLKENFHDQKDTLIELLISMGIQVYKPKGYEADDVIAYLTKVYYRNNWEVVIASADKDFVQMINKDITMYHVSKGIIIDEFNAKDFFGYTPKQCVDYLSILGDASDKIPGYPGIGPKKAEKFFLDFKSVRKFLNSDAKIGKLDKDELRRIWELNVKLIDLMYFIRNVLDPDKMVPLNEEPFMDMDKLKELCRMYEINTFLKPQFLNTFKRLTHV